MRSLSATIISLGLAALLCCGFSEVRAQESDPDCLFLVVPYVKPGDSVPIDMVVSNLRQEVTGCQAFLRFSPVHFLAGPGDVSVAPGGDVWKELIWAVWNDEGDLDIAAGIDLDGPAGISEDGTFARFVIKARSDVEGATTLVFRPDADPDPYLVGTTILADADAGPVWPNKIDSPVITIDGTPPLVDIVSAIQNGVELVGPDAKAFQGTVYIKVAASDPLHGGVSSGLAGRPTVTLTRGDGSVESAAFTGEDPPGVFNYTWEVLPETPNGITTISASVSDRSGNTSGDSVSFEVNKNQISGTVATDTMRTNVGSACSFNRAVTFKATNPYGALLKTWLVTVQFVNNSTTGIASGSYVLIDVPGSIGRLSAKTDWSLRRRQTASLDSSGQAIISFTGVYKLLGGDLSTDNVVNVTDYNTLRTNWFRPVAAADINGDGIVNTPDYNIMKTYWFRIGDPI